MHLFTTLTSISPNDTEFFKSLSEVWSSREVKEAHDVVVGGVGQHVGGVAGRLVRPGAARGAVADSLKTVGISQVGLEEVDTSHLFQYSFLIQGGTGGRGPGWS